MGSFAACLAISLSLSVAVSFGVPCEPSVSPRRSAFQDVCQALPAYDAAFNDINMTQKVREMLSRQRQSVFVLWPFQLNYSIIAAAIHILTDTG